MEPEKAVSTQSKKGTAFAIALAPLGALAMKADKDMMDIVLGGMIVIALSVFLGIQALLTIKKKDA